MVRRCSHGRQASLLHGTSPNQTFANLYIDNTSTTATAAVDRAVVQTTVKYTELAKAHHFLPIAVTAGGDWNKLA